MNNHGDPEFEKAVNESNKKYDDYMNQKRWPEFATLCTKDYVWVDEFKPIEWRGKQGLVDIAKQWGDLGVGNEHITLEESWRHGDVGFQISSIEIDVPDVFGRLQKKRGRFFEVMEKEKDGVWRTRSQFYFSIFNPL